MYTYEYAHICVNIQTAVMSLRDDCDKKFVEEMNRSLASTVRKCAELAESMNEEDVNNPMIELYTAVTPQKNQGGKYHIGYVCIHVCMNVYLTIFFTYREHAWLVHGISGQGSCSDQETCISRIPRW